MAPEVSPTVPKADTPSKSRSSGSSALSVMLRLTSTPKISATATVPIINALMTCRSDISRPKAEACLLPLMADHIPMNITASVLILTPPAAEAEAPPTSIAPIVHSLVVGRSPSVPGLLYSSTRNVPMLRGRTMAVNATTSLVVRLKRPNLRLVTTSDSTR